MSSRPPQAAASTRCAPTRAQAPRTSSASSPGLRRPGCGWCGYDRLPERDPYAHVAGLAGLGDPGATGRERTDRLGHRLRGRRDDPSILAPLRRLGRVADDLLATVR